MKKFLTVLFAIAAFVSVCAEDDVLVETIFADPTTHHAPTVAKGITTFKDVKTYHSKNYPLIIIPVNDYDGKSELSVTIRAARDNSMPARLGVLCQVRDAAAKKIHTDNMQIKSVTENFTDFKFKVNPAKIVPDTKNFRLLIYAVGKKGNIYLEKVTVAVPGK